MEKFKKKKVAVVGLGLEGKDVVEFLLKSEAEVTLFDQKKESDLDFSGIEKKKIKLVCGEGYLDDGFVGFDYIFRSPGVYRFIPQIVEAEKKGVVVTSAIKLFFDLCKASVIGVTGTKGKGTTSTLIYEILKASGKDVYFGGNIGKPYLELLSKLSKKSLVVLELSSFQLIDLEKSPHIAVVLNITVDHLDWHKDKEEYVNAKKNIVKHQSIQDFSVINYDYPTPKSFSKETKAKVFYFSRLRETSGCFVKDGKIILSIEGKNVEIGDTKNLLLRGGHNWENITAAVCAAKLAGANESAIRKVVFSFKGLEHRLELVGTAKGVTFYNDSFATGPQPTMAAIDSFDGPLSLILGGSEKGLDYTELGLKIAKTENVKSVVLIGQVAPKIYKALSEAGFKGKIFDLGKPSMKEIVDCALKNTPQGGVVVLSPAAASFDMFKDYKDRGNQFKEAVFELI